MIRKILSASCALLLGVLSTACELPVEPVVRDTEPSRVADPYELTQDDLNRIAQAVAGALESQSLRRELVADFRSSPYEQYSLDFSGYMSLNTLLPNAVRAGLPDDLVDRILFSGDQFELSIPDAWHRATWEATDDIVVLATSFVSADLNLLRSSYADVIALSPIVYRTDGSSFVWKFGEQMHDPYVKIGARRTPFVPRFGSAVGAASDGNRRTISTVQSERRAFRNKFGSNSENAVPWMSDIDEDDEIPVCTGNVCDPPPVNPDPFRRALRGRVLPSARTWFDCRDIGTDLDRDGFNDDCEYEIASTFAPRLKFDPDEPARGRYSHWAVIPCSAVSYCDTDYSRSVRVFYAFSYYYDTGTRVGNPLSTVVGEHDGDSEWIVLDIQQGTIVRQGQESTEWILEEACYSAHWRSRGWWGSAESSECRRGNNTQHSYNPQPRGAVYISRGKHGNYFSAELCNRGGYMGRDVCTWNWVNDDPIGDFPVVRDRNLGGPVPWGISVSHRGRSENMWGRRFCGWSNWYKKCSGGYGISLEYHGFFPPLHGADWVESGAEAFGSDHGFR